MGWKLFIKTLRRCYGVVAVVGGSVLALLLVAAVFVWGEWPPLWFRQEPFAILQQLVDACYVYGETGQIRLNNGTPALISLVGGDDSVDYHFVTPRNLSEGIVWFELADGFYGVYADQIRVQAADNFVQEGYTITRNGQNRHWRLYGDGGLLCAHLTTVDQLPQGVYDIIIDAGHGGVDSGAESAWLRESTQNLQTALYMAERFRALGLKVALTRLGDYAIGQPGVELDKIDPYVAQGRIARIYDSGAKYVLSNHLNASPTGKASGYQVYSSVNAGNTWAELTGDGWQGVGMQPNNKSKGLVKEGLYKRYSQDDPQSGRDYYYIIRESGGLALAPENFLQHHPERKTELYVGAEALLLEYCFLDNQQDAFYWQDHWRELVDGAVAAAARYWQL
ncbi:MAG: N-acetylmuramoyl-L-alanine amidase [Clostridiales bacterium]